MTRIAILSDIHGNLPALEALISELKNFDVDHVIVPGDVTSFIVKDLKLGESQGRIALWVGAGTEAHFSQLVVKPLE